MILILGLLHLELRVAPEVVLAVKKRSALAVVAAAMIALLLSPGIWSARSVAAGNGNAWLPQAGPSQDQGGFGGRGGPGGGGQAGKGARPNGFTPGTNLGSAQGTTSNTGAGQPSTSGTGGRTGAGQPPSGAGGFGGRRAGSGNAGAGMGGGGGGGGILTFSGSNTQTLDPKLIAYLLANQEDAKFLVATTTSSYASLFILQTNQTAMALGGYQGWDRILIPATLAKLVANNTVRYFYISAGQSASTGTRTAGKTGAGTTTSVGTGTDQTTNLTQWVRAHCSAVSSSLISSTSAAGGNAGASQMQLYSCASLVTK